MEKLKQHSINLEQALLSLDIRSAEEIILLSNNETEGNIAKAAGNLISYTLLRIGNLWENGTLSLSQVYMSGVICEKILDKILPPKSTTRRDQPKMAIAVLEDYHLLGKRIIYSTLRASGYELEDLGGGLTVQNLVEIVKKDKIKILLLSVLMLPSALRVKELKQELKDIDVKIVVGGAPFRLDSQLWTEVNADYCGNDSSDALEIVNKIMEEIV